MSLVFQPSLFEPLSIAPSLRSLGAMIERIPLTDGAWIDIRPGWLSGSDAVFESLVDSVPWLADRREMDNRVVAVPRLVSGFGDGATLPHAVLHRAMIDLN